MKTRSECRDISKNHNPVEELTTVGYVNKATLQLLIENESP